MPRAIVKVDGDSTAFVKIHLDDLLEKSRPCVQAMGSIAKLIVKKVEEGGQPREQSHPDETAEQKERKL
jgi:hypothetical protein